MKRILIVGATSAIAKVTAKRFAKDGSRLFLVSKTESKLRDLATELEEAGAEKVGTYELDVVQFNKHHDMFDRARGFLGGFDLIFLAHGDLPDQDIIATNPSQTVHCVNVNGVSVVSLATIAADFFERAGSGCLAVISSVAGERGKASNYAYGSAKAMVTTFLQGLRNRLDRKGIKVITILPGPVDTPMTEGIDRKNKPFSTAEEVGNGIYDAIKKGKDVVYLPGKWRWMMMAAKMIPESKFKGMDL